MQLAPKSTIRHFWSANRHFECAKLHSFGLWPYSPWMSIRHTLFDFFCKKTRPDSHSTCRYLFFKHSSLYKQGLDLIIQHILLRSRRDTFSHSQISHPSFLVFSFKLGVGKTHVLSRTKHMQWKINRSTSFAIDNMYYVNFRI